MKSEEPKKTPIHSVAPFEEFKGRVERASTIEEFRAIDDEINETANDPCYVEHRAYWWPLKKRMFGEQEDNILG